MLKFKIYEIKPDRICPLIGEECKTTDCEFWERDVIEEIEYSLEGTAFQLMPTEFWYECSNWIVESVGDLYRNLDKLINKLTEMREMIK